MENHNYIDYVVGLFVLVETCVSEGIWGNGFGKHFLQLECFYTHTHTHTHTHAGTRRPLFSMPVRMSTCLQWSSSSLPRLTYTSRTPTVSVCRQCTKSMIVLVFLNNIFQILLQYLLLESKQDSMEWTVSVCIESVHNYNQNIVLVLPEP